MDFLKQLVCRFVKERLIVHAPRRRRSTPCARVEHVNAERHADHRLDLPQGAVVFIPIAEQHDVKLMRCQMQRPGRFESLLQFRFRQIKRHKHLPPNLVEPLELFRQRHALFQAAVGGDDVVLGLDPPA